MSKYIRKRRFMDVWRIGETESWLTDMAAQGLHLHSLGLVFAKFEYGEPANVRYRIDFSYCEQSTCEDQLELYAESGWEHVCDSGEMRIFRSPEDSNAPEIHTDPAEQAYTLRRLSRRLLESSLITTALFIGGIVMTCFAWFGGRTPTLSAIEGNMINSGTVMILYLYCILTPLKSALSTRKLIRSMREGKPLDHHAPWRRHKHINVILIVVVTVAAITTVAFPVIQSTVRREEPLPDKSDIILQLADIEQDPAYERKPFIFEGTDKANRIKYNWSVYAPTQFETEESGIIRSQAWPDGSGEYSPSLTYRYFKLTLPWLADGLMTDLAESIASWNEMHDEWFPIEEIQIDGADRALIRESNYFREVFIRKGSIVIYVKYYGLQDMDAVVDAVEALLGRL